MTTNTHIVDLKDLLTPCQCSMCKTDPDGPVWLRWVCEVGGLLAGVAGLLVTF